jgi:N-acetyl-1-D-myo-inositol-2-amino-2-deoxy-alpha-D-glucopyranoside deacetylase
MARYAAQGVQVTLVTCTLGEAGEVIPADRQHLTAGADDSLGPHRRDELAAAMAALGVTDHRLLADGRWRDSGMAWLAPGLAGAGDLAPHPDAFVLAPVADAAAALAEVLLEVRPQAVVTYDPRGGYGHPDHIKAHEVASAAVDLVASEDLTPAVFWIRVPRSWAERERADLLHGATPPSMSPPDPAAAYPPVVVDDDVVTTVVDGSAYLDRKAAALRAHVTQVVVDGSCFSLSNGEAHLLTGREAYQRVGQGRWPATGPVAWGGDLFDTARNDPAA